MAREYRPGYAAGGGQQVQHQILGANLQAIRFILRPGQTVVGEGGSMMCMDDGLSFECRMGNGSLMEQNQGWWSAFKAGFQRVITNESLFYTWFTNNTPMDKMLMIAAPKMGTIVPVDLHQLPQSTIIAQSGAFLCSSAGVQFSVELVRSIGTGLFGGEGFVLQRLTAESASAGQLFMHGGGTIVRKELNNSKMTVDTGSLMAFTTGISYNIEQPGWGNALKGGQFFVTTLQGTGSIWLQSTPENKMIDKIIAAIPSKDKD
eukprot:TRINITY_DN110141_c0_g1_i1.p1 TRINITY_DN110141_c0_g1~~TRINITY_DN110141_c0_g1_i1.p1  ORF type:complete len:261 (-),score=47.72 TRINITY_DN110141_c0_g1_i1:89-871(-)